VIEVKNPMKNVVKLPIREQIYNLLKEDIIRQKYVSGQRLSISAISKELGVSNSPVREAISMLERDGLVEIFPNAGPSVITFSDEKLAQIAQAILSMLLGALEICQQTERIDNLVDLLQHALKHQIDHLTVENNQEYARYSISFEASFIECCQNPYMTKHYAEIEDLFYLIVLYDQLYIDTNRSKTVLEHQGILGSIMDGDFDKTKKLLSSHYNRF
jgi:DNA-binding GntR family transcriptional regulator